MTIGTAGQIDTVYYFGPFELRPKERALLRDGIRVEIGTRAFELLKVLVLRPNQNLTKRELLSEVWPDVTVEEGNLRVQVGALRKALGDTERDARYIATIARRGYSFIAPVTARSRDAESEARIADGMPGMNLPARLTRMVGRDTSVPTLVALLADSRFVTIVGPGGVGKTTLAVAVAHEMLGDFAGSVTFVDLSALGDPTLLASAVASLLGLAVQSDDPIPSVIAFLRAKRILLILDNCEHVIDAAANLVARLLLAGPQVHVLATSREALRIEGEQVYKAMPLTVPPDEPGLTARVALTYSAVQLFVDRAAASGAGRDLTDEEAEAVAAICRKVDGLALAIELVAGRVGVHGLKQILLLLDQRLTMLWLGQRTAPPRQQTLRALLSWSYELLSDVEGMILRRLAVFVGSFTVEAVLAVATNATLDETEVFAAVDSLVAKSMVATGTVGTAIRYRLPETTRAYALEIGTEDPELADLAERHAGYYRRWLLEAELEWSKLPGSPDRAALLADLGNIRAALEWCFGHDGDVGAGVQLACAAVPLFLALSLLTECQHWSERALLARKGFEREEMQLQAASGMSVMFTHRNSEAARLALNRSLAIAKARDDSLGELRALSLLHMYHRRTGDYRAALHCAERSSVIARSARNTKTTALSHSLLGVSLYHVGELGAARDELEAALELRQGTDWTSTFMLGFDHHNLSSAILARTLWLQGHPDQAVELAHETVRDAAHRDHPLTLAIALTWALSVLLWVGALDEAEVLIERSVAHSEAHSLTPNVLQGRGFRGQLALYRGDARSGVAALQGCLADLRAARYELLAAPFSATLAQGLVDLGREEEAVALIDEAIEIVTRTGELVYMPDLLRTKARAFVARQPTRANGAEAYFLQSLEWSRRQRARSWELRTAIDLATYWKERGKPREARTLLQSIADTFVEGRDTSDLRAARSLLAQLT